MNYQETLDYLYNQHPAFQRVGGDAYKAGLETSVKLDNIFNNPHKKYKCIHVGGTNGKGSVSHTIACILQLSGYKVGLYTSPHLIDFRERIKVNGEMISEKDVIDFVERYRNTNHDCQPSFFELTMMMAFDYFSNQDVDIAVIEVGLGGRLDSTNIISPILSIITNISFDHTQFLGNTLEQIASEKAGIIKPNVPVVIGETTEETQNVFLNAADKVDAPIIFAENSQLIDAVENKNFINEYTTKVYGKFSGSLSGACQVKNTNTILHAIEQLKELGLSIPDESITGGFLKVCSLTGLMGRWMKISDSPLTICDTGHNTGGIKYIVEHLNRIKYNNLRIVIGFVNDKDIDHILEMLPRKATYYFTQANIPRAQSADIVKLQADKKGLNGRCYKNVGEAYSSALNDSSMDDLIFVGGSTFIVADFLLYLKEL